ncbi:hypothetical protein BO94DRAFT_602052 [Aspergillus sclerotioniger CBS 115572]|uniref:Zn(2)-C6 fungal-type domain-containing protein n=1 Tax=Aspergillus sclerotioniger CBS 115572 TaxID=1450535 RepID=A0A317W636_9EURO|nr:hypothetical protein BO94DRAFT_602052 [Aspergillus sclerotioniger CBS 115572]PWY80772.1 hypothetical protein BO94DRAFT_602052 [Aspergillus sclerotioniger CBS 115572]
MKDLTFDVRYDNELAHEYYGDGSKLSAKYNRPSTGPVDLREIYKDSHLEIPDQFDSTLTTPPIHFMTVAAPDDVNTDDLRQVSVPPGLNIDILDFSMPLPRLLPSFTLLTTLNLQMSTTPSSSDLDHPASKRRKIRKGTFSCWECKHRKRRCAFDPDRAACAYCQSRGIPCVGQDRPDPRGCDSNHENVQAQILYVERLVGQLVHQRDRHFLPQQVPMTRQLSGSLVSLLPHPSMALLILTKGRFFSLPFQTITTADQLDVSTLPVSTAHPIQFAQKLIQLALGLQQLDLTTSQPGLQLNQNTKSSARHYLDLATSHVTSQDALVDSLDGLDTLSLEARYHINSGNLRTAWLIFRRALSIAQMIGLPWDDKASSRAESVWVQLVYNDRFLSLMLGLPFAVKDHGFPSEAMDTYSPLRKLYRIHGAIAGRVIARNMRMQRRGRPSQGEAYDHYGVTRSIDDELKKTARSVPVECWESPTLDSTLSDTDKMERVSMLITQMHQYYLLILLHQPYILSQNPHITESATLPLVLDHTYSKQVVVPASREVLNRCLAFRNIRPIISYRGIEHKAFTAAVTLLLSHIMGHRLGSANILEHQRPQDLATIQKVIRTLDELCSTNDPNRESAVETRRLLTRLVGIEAEAANGVNHIAYLDGVDTDVICSASHNSLRLPVPYFGAICIMPEPVEPQVDDLGSEFPWVAPSDDYLDCLTSDAILFPSSFCHDALAGPTPDSHDFTPALASLDVELQSLDPGYVVSEQPC